MNKTYLVLLVTLLMSISQVFAGNFRPRYVIQTIQGGTDNLIINPVSEDFTIGLDDVRLRIAYVSDSIEPDGCACNYFRDSIFLQIGSMALVPATNATITASCPGLGQDTLFVDIFPISNQSPGNVEVTSRPTPPFAPGLTGIGCGAGGGSSLQLQRVVIQGGSLPIELSWFAVVVIDNTQHVDIAWETETETNNDYFEVLRSTDGVFFETTATVQGAGTTTSIQNYEITDYNVPAGYVYYRLKQTDFDGTSSMSKVKVVEVKEISDPLVWHVTNVPGRSFQTVKAENLHHAKTESFTIELYNVQGQPVYQKVLSVQDANKSTTLELSNLSQGAYILKINGETPNTNQNPWDQTHKQSPVWVSVSRA